MTMKDSIAAALLSGPQPGADGATTLEFRFGADDPTFAGHFPTRPLLPGAFQLEMARVSAELALNCPLTVREILKAKFLRPISPKEIVQVELKWTEKEGTIQARAGLSVHGQAAGEVLLLLWRSE